jgi:DUF4097 and DUF4098 domain-containing protein YvlB
MNARFAALPLALVLLPCAAPLLHAADDSPDVLRRTFSAAPGGKLVLATDRGTLTFTGGDTAEAEIVVTRRVKKASGDKARQLLDDHKVTFSEDNGVIRVEADLVGHDNWNWRGPQLEVDIKVRLPRKFDVDAQTAGGSIHASHLEGALAVRTSGGSLHLEALQGAIAARTSGGSIQGAKLSGAVELNTSGGSITLEAVGGEKLKASTSGGSIRMTGIAAPAEVRTSGGSIALEAGGAALSATTSGGGIDATFTAAPTGDINLKTSAGGIGVTLPASAAFQLDADTSAGSVRSDFPVLTNRSGERSELKGPVNGGGPVLKLRTSAGSIRVKKS